MKRKTTLPKTVWTRAEVEARFVRITGEPVPPDATSMDLWVWASEALTHRVEAERLKLHGNLSGSLVHALDCNGCSGS